MLDPRLPRDGGEYEQTDERIDVSPKLLSGKKRNHSTSNRKLISGTSATSNSAPHAKDVEHVYHLHFPSRPLSSSPHGELLRPQTKN